MTTTDAPHVPERGLHPSEVHELGRRLLGVPGEGEVPPFAVTVAESGRQAVVAVSAAGAAALLLPYALVPLAAPVGRALGAGGGLVRGGVTLFLLCCGLGALAVPALAGARARRDGLVLAGLLGTLVTLFAAAFAPSGGLLSLFLLCAGLAAGASAAHLPLLFDRYPAEIRQRVAGTYGAVRLAACGALLVVAGLASSGGFGWRAVLLAAAALAAGGVALSRRLRDPGVGRHDAQRVHAAVRAGMGTPDTDGIDHDADAAALRYGETMRRVLLVPPLRASLGAVAVTGMFGLPLHLYLLSHFEERWLIGPQARTVLFGVILLAAAAGVSALAERGERTFRRSPVRHLRQAAGLLTLGALALAAGVLTPWPLLGVPLVFFGVALTASVGPSLAADLLAVIPAGMRLHASGILVLLWAAAGGVGGLVYLGGLGSRFGTGAAIAGLVLPAFAVATAMRKAGPLIDLELDRRVDEIVEIEDLRRVRATGGHVPLLSCRHLDFSYGLLQILFDVDFTVDDGEMVALLGTNGAGKSTLLRVISGLGLPSAGTVRFQGSDVTYLDAERRVPLGMTQVPGGKAVFGSLSVVDNLRVFGHSTGRRQGQVDAGIDATFDAFPRLAERRNQLASTLSGGEQQMLALGKALILHPKLLLIDELSLGLAPKVVGELLGMVRRINDGGTAVVLVEQSVNVALTLANHAYFMEKGQVRFDGPARDLLARPELLRSVFLQGAVKGVQPAVGA